ncbi:MAG: class I SAM-dependent methyltransferase [Chloroflexi bacterium]|nr:MAG: class I SAM-dependent methyltransferase [Chloroflexota bacterium]
METDPYTLLARFYDLEHAPLRADIPFYRTLAAQTGGPILELGCGTGRLLLPLAQDGHTLVGLDRNRAMLALARQKLRRAGLVHRVSLIQADMGAFALARRFGLILLAYNTFMHLLTTEAQMAVLTAAHRHLRPGGRLVIDLPPADEMAHQDDSGVWMHQWQRTDPATGHRVLKRTASRLDWARQQQEVLAVYEEILPDGAVHQTAVSMTLRYTFPAELRLLVERAGLTLEGLYGDYGWGPYEEGSPRMIGVGVR